jgi:hypothetical protein
MDQAASRFFSTVGSDDLGINWIEALWQAELPYMRASRRPNEHCDVCPLMNMGEYCLQVFELLVQFLEGSRLQATIKEHTQARMSHLVDTDDGRAISYLEDKQKALRYYNRLQREKGYRLIRLVNNQALDKRLLDQLDNIKPSQIKL